MTWNKANQLATNVVSSITSSYLYDAFGQRLKVTVGAGTPSITAYDQANNILFETNSGTETDYAWLDGFPIAAIQPVAATVSAHPHRPSRHAAEGDERIKTVVWTCNYDPNGKCTPTATITMNLRLPGQYADATGFNHNGFRDYNPTSTTGAPRYLQVDPIGLAGGMNPYIYGLNNPYKWTDRSGLLTPNLWIIGGTALAGGFAGYEVGHTARSAAVGFAAGAASAALNARAGEAIAAGGARMIALQTAAGTTAAPGTMAINYTNNNPDLLNDTVPSFAIGFISPFLTGDAIAGGYGLVEENSLAANLLSLNTNFLTVAGTIMDLGITARAEAANGADPYLSAAIQASEQSAAGPYGGGVLLGSGDPCIGPAPRLQ